MAKPYPISLLELDIRDADFSSQMGLWAFRAICEMNEIVVATQETIAISRGLMSEADRMLARNRR